MRSVQAMPCAVFILLSGCTERWEPVVFEDEGEICIGAAGENLVVHVDPPSGCVSSSCTRERSGSCEAALEGMTIHVTSEVSYEENTAPNAECTTDCHPVVVMCSIPRPPDGAYTVVLGETELSLVVPDDLGCRI